MATDVIFYLPQNIELLDLNLIGENTISTMLKLNSARQDDCEVVLSLESNLGLKMHS